MYWKSRIRFFLAERVGGFIAILFGVLSLLEAYRKYPLRISEFVGDHIMLAVLGALLVILGVVLVIFAKPSQPQPTANRRAIYTTITLLFLYAILLPILGYALSTFLISIGLFRVIGTYRIHISLISALLLTAALYALFILLLGMSFPTGFLGF